ncbi:MAG: nucleotidyl transferase AbiEii/AbiGii toxin family protein [Candidatus Eiseniibacteriota bacterium]
MIADPVQVALLVAAALEDCGIEYVVGGSLASSMSGEPRSTLDVDLVIALQEHQVARLTESLGDAFHVDADSLRRAVRSRTSANLIHYESSTKVDLFIAGGSPVDEQQLQRRQRVLVASDPDRHLFVYTPEDILLQKLRWYRLGGEQSDRQWRDILGIVRVQGGALDRQYVECTAASLELEDLAERALALRERRDS